MADRIPASPAECPNPHCEGGRIRGSDGKVGCAVCSGGTLDVARGRIAQPPCYSCKGSTFHALTCPTKGLPRRTYEAYRIPASPAETTPFEELVDALIEKVPLACFAKAIHHPIHAKLSATRRAVVKAYETLEQKYNELRLVMRTEIEARDRFKANAEYWNAEALAAYRVRDGLSAELSRLRALVLTAEQAQWLVELIEKTPMKYLPELTVLYKSLRRIANGEIEK